MNTRVRIVTVLASVVPLGIVGCCQPQDPTAQAQAQPSLAGLDLVHDFGSVIEGTKVEHAFEIMNSHPISIEVTDDAEIQKTCGCTTLEPSARRLKPGEKTKIRMRVDTAGKNGRFRVGGVIRWHLNNGESFPVNLYMEGAAKTILAAQPGMVQFSPADIAEKQVKELSVFNSLDVDWSKLYVHIEPPYAELVEKTVHSDHVTLLLRAQPPSGAVDFSATICLTAEPTEANLGAKTCSVSVPVQGSQHIDAQVLPRVVFVSWSREKREGTARFLVRERAAKMPSSIASISCDGLRAVWKSEEISPAKANEYRTLQVELNFSEVAGPLFDPTQPRQVRIAFGSGRHVEFPVHFVAQQERS